MSVESGKNEFSEPRPIRQLGKTLRRHRRLRVGITQLVYMVAGIILGLALPHIPVGFTVPRAEAAEMLFAVGAGLVTFIGVVFSLLFLVVQFGSTTFTPRLNLFYTSPMVWHAFSYYTGVIVYCFVAAFGTTGSDEMTGLVPIVTLVMLLGSIALYRQLQMHAFSSIQLASTLAQVTERARRVLDGIYADEPPAETDEARDPSSRALPEGMHHLMWPSLPAIVQTIDVPLIIKAARSADAAVEIVVPIGETAQQKTTVAIVHGSTDPMLDAAVLKAIRTGVERTFEQDPSLGFRILVDIALRALSTAINDPNTAVQVLDSIESLLRMLAGRDLDVGVITGPRGAARVMLALPGWDEYVAMSFDELIECGADKFLVRRRLARLLRDLIAIAPENRRPPLRTRLDGLASG